MREVFRYYQLSPYHLHFNRWITLSPYDKFSRLVRIEPIVNVFENYYHLIADTDGGNDMHWFFTFSNRTTGVMKGTLYGKPA